MTSAIIITPTSSRRALVDAAPSPVTTVFEVSTTRVRKTLDEVLMGATKGRFDHLVVPTLALPGVGTRTLLKILASLADLGVGVISLEQPFLTLDGEQGQTVVWLHRMLEAEVRGRIVEATQRARREGRRGGRPRLSIDVEKAAALQRSGMSLKDIASRLGSSKTSVQRVLSAYRAAHPDITSEVSA